MRRQGPRLIILTYHTASQGELRRHLLYLRRHYRLLHLDDALEELFSPSKQPATDRRTPLAITFDDGYYDSYTHAFSLVSELQVPITIFLVPGYIETGNQFWWLEPDYLAAHAKVAEPTLEGKTYHLSRPGERATLRQAIDCRLRFASSVAERDAYLTEVRRLLAVPDEPAPTERNRLPFSWAEVEAMRSLQWISFGSHTMHHPVLGCLADSREAEYEVQASARSWSTT